MARWMVSRKVRDLILLSRSGVKNEAALALTKKLQIEGAKDCDAMLRY